MSTVARGGQGGLGVGPGAMDTSGSPAGVAGITTVAILVIAGIAMWNGADAQRVLLTACIGAILYFSLIYAPVSGLIVNMVFLSCVGILKRYLIPILGYSALDPLLLVQPIVVGFYFFNVIIRRNLPLDTPMSKIMAALLVVMILEVVNPLQGGLELGLSGMLFYIVPFLWYYCGREHGTPQNMEKLFKAVIVVSLLGAFYGMIQQFVGLTDVEKEWLRLTNNDVGQYISGGVIRVFSIFSSFAEYVTLLGMGAVFSVCLFLSGKRFYIIPYLLLSAACTLSSSRGGIVSVGIATAFAWAVQAKNIRAWPARLILAAILGAFSVYTGLSQVPKDAGQNDTAGELLRWQAKGILKANDETESTAISHNNLTINGVVRGFTRPMGGGLGTTTLAAGKFGGAIEGSEQDIANMFISCGLFGGLLYCAVIVLVVWHIGRRWYFHRDRTALIMFVYLCTTIGAWFIGARYAPCMVIFMMLGSIDRWDAQERRDKREKKEREQAALEASEGTKTHRRIGGRRATTMPERKGTA